MKINCKLKHIKITSPCIYACSMYMLQIDASTYSLFWECRRKQNKISALDVPLALLTTISQLTAYNSLQSWLRSDAIVSCCEFGPKGILYFCTTTSSKRTFANGRPRVLDEFASLFSAFPKNLPTAWHTHTHTHTHARACTHILNNNMYVCVSSSLDPKAKTFGLSRRLGDKSPSGSQMPRSPLKFRFILQDLFTANGRVRITLFLFQLERA